MKVALELGAEVDIPTLDEIKAEFGKHKVPYLERVPIGGGKSTDASGNASIPVYNVHVGKAFYLYKLIIWVDGATPGNPSALGAAPWCAIYHGNQFSPGTIADFGPTDGGSFTLPATFEYNSHTAPKFTDSVGVGIFNGPVSKNITVMGWGELEDAALRRNY